MVPKQNYIKEFICFGVFLHIEMKLNSTTILWLVENEGLGIVPKNDY